MAPDRHVKAQKHVEVSQTEQCGCYRWFGGLDDFCFRASASFISASASASLFSDLNV